MPNIDFDNLTVAELQEIQRLAAAKEEERRGKEIAELREMILQKIKDHGFTFEDVFGGRGTVRTRRDAPPVRFRDPENPENTWSGRGPRPNWLKEKLEQGSEISDFSV